MAHSPLSSPPPPSLKLFTQLPFVAAQAECLGVLQWPALPCGPPPTPPHPATHFPKDTPGIFF